MPTHLIRSWIAELAKKLRNSDAYSDWDFGMEPIPGDKTWSKCDQQCKACDCRIKKSEDNE